MRLHSTKSADMPMVSVLMTTYNHESYIGQALESAMMQKADFAYEIVVGDDFSTDGTRDILSQYRQRHPNILHTLLHRRNLGNKGAYNFWATYQRCRGRYVAILDGDDFWLSEAKLQTQVDFLERRPELAFCFHNARILCPGKPQHNLLCCPPDQKPVVSLSEMLKGNCVPSCTVMFRRELINSLPDWYYELRIGDWPLYMLLLRNGLAGYQDQVLSVYRLHARGGFSNLSLASALLEKLKVYEAIRSDLGTRFQKLIAEEIAKSWFAISVAHLEAAQKQSAREAMTRCLKSPPLLRNWLLKWKMLVRYYVPIVYRTWSKLRSLIRGQSGK